MSRPVDTLAHAGATLARVLAGDRPAWVRPATWQALQRARDGLRTDALSALGAGPTEAARAIGVARATLARWMAPGGWLAP